MTIDFPYHPEPKRNAFKKNLNPRLNIAEESDTKRAMPFMNNIAPSNLFTASPIAFVGMSPFPRMLNTSVYEFNEHDQSQMRSRSQSLAKTPGILNKLQPFAQGKSQYTRSIAELNAELETPNPVSKNPQSIEVENFPFRYFDGANNNAGSIGNLDGRDLHSESFSLNDVFARKPSSYRIT